MNDNICLPLEHVYALALRKAGCIVLVKYIEIEENLDKWGVFQQLPLQLSFHDIIIAGYILF